MYLPARVKARPWTRTNPVRKDWARWLMWLCYVQSRVIYISFFNYFVSQKIPHVSAFFIYLFGYILISLLGYTTFTYSLLLNWTKWFVHLIFYFYNTWNSQYAQDYNLSKNLESRRKSDGSVRSRVWIIQGTDLASGQYGWVFPSWSGLTRTWPKPTQVVS